MIGRGTKDMKKKVISMLLVSAMAVTLIAGCGNNGADEKKSEGDGKTLEVWVAPLDDDTVNNWKPLLKDWEKENDCTVNVKVVPGTVMRRHTRQRLTQAKDRTWDICIMRCSRHILIPERLLICQNMLPMRTKKSINIWKTDI